ncbi:cell filamentation protein [Promicromonospora sp. AC04]|uniref:Fic/DOC family protein n=1 Tax=Promicromonospora sp. AC04 TaxID=2135723 RepID=UPI000D3D04F6|nr:Fic family protein [Promicromonospora sp. AC04]PUB24025.1 cell filamentation protein [Promicromonospora sp. AC04]
MSEFRDPYVDSGTGILRNLVGSSSQSALDEAEADLTWARATQIHTRQIQATNDLAELCAIHHHLFQDVYDWAGQVRTVDIRKTADGAEFFVPAAMIERSAGYAAEALREDGLLRGMSRDRLIQRLAFHYDQFNYLHPFREGNGRTQRIFWSRVVRDAGFFLDWRPVQGEVNDAACRAAEERDFDPLFKMFDETISENP